MTDTTAEPEDYTGEDGLLYCGKCRKPKEAFNIEVNHMVQMRYLYQPCLS